MSQQFDTFEGRRRVRGAFVGLLALEAASYPFLLLDDPEWSAAAWSFMIGCWIVAGIPTLWAAARTRDPLFAAIGITSTLLALPGFIKIKRLLIPN